MPEHTIAENLQRLIDAKTAIGSAITAKGGTVGANDGLEEFVADIATIPSGGLELSTSPKSFNFGSNIRNLNLVVPNGCTSISNQAFSAWGGLTSIEIPSSIKTIGSYAFNKCSGLTSIEIPSSVESIGSYAFSECSGLTSIEIPSSVKSIEPLAFYSDFNLDICINKPENSISGSPWGANVANIAWATNRFKSSYTEVASDTTLTGTINATVGDLVIATFEIFGSDYSISEGWTLLGDGTVTGSGNYSQKTGMAYKIATSASEMFTVTQDMSSRAFISMVSITGASIGSFSGYTAHSGDNKITVNKPNGLTIWSVSSVWWGSGWNISNYTDNYNVSTTRNLLALDQSDVNSVRFENEEGTSPSGILSASLTITGIDNFWYMDSN